MTIQQYKIPNTNIGHVYYSYSTVEEADKYFSLQTNDWNSISSDTDKKKILLVNATRRIDLLRFKSDPIKPINPKIIMYSDSSTKQPLKFPRVGYDLPYDIELACIILAGLINDDPEEQFVTDVNLSVKRIKAGPIDIEFYPTVDIDLVSEERSIADPTIRALLTPYLALGITSVITGVDTLEAGAAFGTGGKSMFDDLYRYPRQ